MPSDTSTTAPYDPAVRTLSPWWVWTPATIAAALALVTLAGDANRSWFVGWNALAQVLPPFLWAGITNLGATGGAFALLTGMLAWRPRWAAAALLAAPAATLYTHGLKRLFSEPRPAAVLDTDQITVIGATLKANAFPSGHSVTAFGVAACVALCAQAGGRRWIAWLAIGVAALTAFSRVAVGAHWPLDIFAGAAGGWLCGAFGAWWSARWRFWRSDLGVRVMAVLLGAAAVWLYFEELGYPEGVWAQYTLATWGCAGALIALRLGARRGRS